MFVKLKPLWIVQLLYALLIPAQIFAALKFSSGSNIEAWIIIIIIMCMEMIGIKYWIIAQTENSK